MTYFNLALLLFMSLGASSCLGQSIAVTPSLPSSLLFETERFQRVCSINNAPSTVSSVTFRWLRDGVVAKESNVSGLVSTLDLQPVSVGDSGNYVCQAVLLSATGVVIATLDSSSERLSVASLEPLDAPAVQVGVNGSEFTMQCSYDGVPAILWTTGSGSPRFSPLTLADEGNYTCGVLVSTGGSSRIFNRKILLLVEVPLRLIRHSEPVYHSLNHNRPVSLAVSFTGRVSHNLMVTWYHNNQALPTPDPRINTVLLESDPSSSTLAFPMVRRSDRGVYRVEVVTMVEENPARRLEQTFQLDITIPPSHPRELSVSLVSSTTARSSWVLTNSTPDSGAETLELRLTYSHNRSHANTWSLPGSVSTHLLEGLAPATNYTLQGTAINLDGRASSNTRSFTTLEGAPQLNDVSAAYINATHIVIETEVAYTGGGVIRTVQVNYDPGNTATLEAEIVGSFHQRAILVPEEVAGVGVVLEVTVLNQHNFLSNAIQVQVPAYEATTVSPTIAMTTQHRSLVSNEVLPAYLIPIVAASVPVVIVIVILICVVGVCLRCRRPKKGKLQVSNIPNATVKAEENRAENLYSPSHSSTEEFRSRSQTGSLTSSTCGGCTPSLDKIPHHKRVPSDCSSNISIAKPAIVTPNTTASNSPATLIKGGAYASQDQGLGMIIEMDPISHGSDDSCTESDRMGEERNKINARLHTCSERRDPGDGSPCDSHQSLVHSAAGGSNLLTSVSNPRLLAFDPKSHSDPRLFSGYPPSRISSPGHEYIYSDNDSVASTEVSCGNFSLPPHHCPTHYAHHINHPSRHIYQHQKHVPRHAHSISRKSVHERTATPYNREFDEGSMV